MRIMVLEYTCGMCPWRRERVCRQRGSSMYKQRTRDEQRCMRALTMKGEERR